MRFSRDEAVTRLESLINTIETDPMPVPIQEIWVFGDVVLGVDPVDRLEIYLTKDLLFKDEPEKEADFRDDLGISGVGKTVAARWANKFPEHVRANTNGHAAPEKCLAAHLVGANEPIHLEVCNTGFQRNVQQRIQAAHELQDYSTLLDPRAVCLWIAAGCNTVAPNSIGERSQAAITKLRDGSFVFPTLEKALELLDMDSVTATSAAKQLQNAQDQSDGRTVRGDII